MDKVKAFGHKGAPQSLSEVSSGGSLSEVSSGGSLPKDVPTFCQAKHQKTGLYDVKLTFTF